MFPTILSRLVPSCDLVLEESLHRYMALTLVDAYTRHLPNQPGGSDYSIPSSTLSSSSTVSTLTIKGLYNAHSADTL